MEHCAGALAVGRRDDRCMNVVKPLLVEELVDGECGCATDSKNGTKCIRPGPEMLYFPEKLQRVPLLLQGVGFRIRFTDQVDVGHAKFIFLFSARRIDQSSDRFDCSSGGQFRPERSKSGKIRLDDELEAFNRCAVRKLDE